MADVKEYWVSKLAGYNKEDWSSKPSIFAQQAIKYFPKTGSLLELGAGLAQDGSWFATKGYNATATDILPIKRKNIHTRVVDLSKPLPFNERSFDIVYAHLSLHYFSLARTKELFGEIHSILKTGGIIAFLVNSVNDPESDEGEEIEKNFRKVRGIAKRYFDLEATQQLTNNFDGLLLDEAGKTYKDKTDLIRFIGKKK